MAVRLRRWATVWVVVVSCVTWVFAQNAPLAGHVAYVTTRGQLAVIDPAGGEPRLLSPIGDRYQFPTFAPDGAAIAAIAVTGGAAVVDRFEAGDRYRIFTSATAAPIYLFWAPAHDTLSFITSDAATGLAFWVSTDGDPPQRVAAGSPFYWDWDPDGSVAVAHTGLAGEGARLAFVDPASGFASSDIAAPGLFQAPAISASRRWIAYAAAAPGPESRVVVLTYPRHAGEVVERAFAHRGFAALAWSPTADVLAIVSPDQPARTWFGPLQLLDARDGLLERAIDDTVLAFFWSPDGRKIAYLTAAPAGGVQRVAQTVQEDAVRLRLHIAFVDGGRVTQVDPIATFTPSRAFLAQFLPFFDQYSRSHRIWSPASDALVFPVTGSDGVTRIVRFGLAGDQRELAVGDMPFWNVH